MVETFLIFLKDYAAGLGTLIGTIVVPCFLFYLLRYLDDRKQKYNRRYDLYKKLVVGRCNLVSISASSMGFDYVVALNLIEAEYSGDDKHDREVSACCRNYINIFQVTDLPENEASIRVYKQEELFIDLLYAMSKSLNIKTDRSTLKNMQSYYPNAFSKADQRVFNAEQNVELIVERKVKEYLVSMAETNKDGSDVINDEENDCSSTDNS